MANEIVQRGLVSRLLKFGQKQQDGQQSTPGGLRTGPYGEQNVIPVLHNKAALAEEGAYLSNGMFALTGSAAITYGVTTAYTTPATSYPLAILQNNDQGQGLNVVPDFLRFVLTTAPTAATSAYLTIALDQFRTPSAFTTVQNAANHNGLVGTQTVTNLYIPATGTNMTLPAATAAARYPVRNQLLRAQIPVALDEYEIRFGSVDGTAGTLLTAAPAGASRIVAQVPPVVIPPQWFMLVYLWFPSSSGFAAINYLEEGHYER
jgi:hypothetical protein